MTIPQNVVVIGAGLAGCAIALALNRHSIPVRIYESRSIDAAEVTSGVILTPNGLQVLDKLGVYDRIKDICWLSEYRTFKNDRDETTQKVLIANTSLYGFANHRVWRWVLLREMKALLAERGVSVIYESKFEGIRSEDENSGIVTFTINGREEIADMLIGADGVWSSVRKDQHLAPDIVPEYMGTLGVMAHIDRNTVNWPYEDFEKACTIQGKPGALVMMPEARDGRIIIVAIQTKYPDQDRATWDAISKDKEFIASFFRKGYGEWHETGKSIIDSVCRSPDSLYLWPFLKVPKLERWFSQKGRIVLVGDAVHAVPPSSGQGVNQALEDAWSLALLVKSGRKNWLGALEFWQDLRQKRIDAVCDWTVNATNVQRMPEAERMKIIQERQAENANIGQDFDDMRWLYESNSERQINDWLDLQP